jgi:hypothetical protein
LPTTVPRDFAVEHQPNTGVHESPEAELVARATRMQHVTEGTAAVALNINGRITALEGDVKAVKTTLAGQDRELAAIKAGVSTTNRLIGPIAEMAAGRAGLDHAVIKARIEVDAAHQKDEIDKTTQKRERVTITWRTVSAAVIAMLGMGGLGAAIHAWLSGAR